MLILAGVSLNAIIGDNGIIKKAQDAKIAAEEADLKERIDEILVEAAGLDFETEEDYLNWVNNTFDNLGLKAHLQKEGDKYALIYGKHNTKVDYIDENLRLLSKLGVVEGSLDDWDYISDPVRKDRIILTKYKGESTSIRIPNVLDGYLVSELYDQVFMYKTNITSVEFSEGLRKIGAKAFANCTNLTTIVNWPSTLEGIGEEAFYGCSSIVATVTDILISGVEYGAAVFANCPKITGDIGEAMDILFYYEGSTITKIPDNMFYGMTGLTGTITILDHIEEIGEYAFYNCNKIIGLDISGAVKKDAYGNDISTLKKIGDYAFYGCILMDSNLQFKNNIEYLGYQSFALAKKINAVNLPSTLTYVGHGCFYYCTNLKNLTINCGNVFAKRASNELASTFFHCETLKNVIFGADCSMTFLPTQLFSECYDLEEIALPNAITLIEGYVFSGCSKLTKVNYPNNLKTMNNEAFFNCSNLINLPLNSEGKLISTITSISSSAFSGCSKLGYKELSEEEENEIDNDNINYPTIEAKEEAKEQKRRTDIINLLTSSNITTIGANIFKNCQYLKGNIDEDTGLTNSTLGKIAFDSSSFLDTNVKYGKTYITVEADGTTTYASLGDNAFKGVTAILKKYLATNTTEEIFDIEVQAGVTSIGANCFAGCTSITSVTFPVGFTTLGKCAFQNCTNLEIVVNNSTALTTIPDSCFKMCMALSSFGNFKKIAKVGNSAFRGCKALTVPEGDNEIIYIDHWAFDGTDSLRTFKFYNGLNYIGTYAFGYSGITSVTLPSTVSEYGTCIFYGCKNLSMVDLSNVKWNSLPEYIFRGCESLSSISLSSEFESIDRYSFEKCVSLQNITIPNSVSSIGSYAFDGCPLKNKLDVRIRPTSNDSESSGT